MHARIHETSGYAAQMLCRPASGCVHSVYRKTINLKFADQLLALQPAHTVLSPISLLTDLPEKIFASLPVQPGDAVTLSAGLEQNGRTCSITDTFLPRGSFPPLGGVITISGKSKSVRFFCADAAQTDLRLFSRLTAPLTDQQRLTLADEISNALITAPADGFVPLFRAPFSGTSGVTRNNLILRTAAGRMTSFLHRLRSGSSSAAADELSRLIGLGIGLTPSGDDFLCGILAGLILSGYLQPDPDSAGRIRSSEDRAGYTGEYTEILRRLSQELVRAIRRRLNDTNEISAAFLRCACDGHFSRPIMELTALPHAGRIRSAFRQIGHSSGSDTLCGILYALQIVAEIQ